MCAGGIVISIRVSPSRFFAFCVSGVRVGVVRLEARTSHAVDGVVRSRSDYSSERGGRNICGLPLYQL